MKIYIVIPAYNEGKRIGKVLDELIKSKYPIIVVDDGSKDDTSIEAKKRKGVEVLRRPINLGGSKGAGMTTGVTYAFEKGADAVILMDSDGQHSPNDLSKFVDKLNEGYDFVIGVRNYHTGVPLVRFVGNKFASVFINLLFRVYVSDLLCGYRALSKKGYQYLKWESLYYGVETEMIIRLGKYGKNLKYCEVPVETLYLDKHKGVTLLDAFNIFFEVLKWRIKL